MNTLRKSVLATIGLLLFLSGGFSAMAQVRGEVEGFGTGQIRKVHTPVVAPTAAPIKQVEEVATKPEWVRAAELQAKYTPTFQFGIRGGISALKLENSEEMGKGLANNLLSIKNSCKYIYQNTPRSERQNRVSWNLTAFGRYNFGGGQGNLQLELNYSENRYETALVNHKWDPDKLVTTGTIYDRTLNIPLLVGWKYSIFRLYIGPSFRVYSNYKTQNTGEVDYIIDGVTTKQKVNVANVNIDPNNPGFFEDVALQYVNIKHPWFRMACGVSFEFSKVVIDARYTTSFRAAKQQYYSFGNSSPIEYDLSMHNFEFSVGVMF